MSQKKGKRKLQLSPEAQKLSTPDKLQDFENKRLFNNPQLYREYQQYYSNLDQYSEMYSESHLAYVDQAYICTLNNHQWSKVDKKADLLCAQKLILKHISLIHLLIPIHKSISGRFHEVQNTYEEYLGSFLRDCELRFVQSTKQKNFDTLCDSSNRFYCSPIEQDTNYKTIITVFQKYHRFLDIEQVEIDAMYQDLYVNDLKIAYEYVLGLKASIASMHDGIISMQSIGLGAQLKKKAINNQSSFGSLTIKKKHKVHTDDIDHTCDDIDRQSLATISSNGDDKDLPAFEYIFSPDIICLLWQQEYEKIHHQELSYNIIQEKERFNNVLLSSAQDVKDIVQSTIPLKRIERGPYHLNRHTHYGAGLELQYHHLPDAEKAKSTFSFFSLSITTDELRGVLSLPPPYHIIDRYKLGSILNQDTLERVNPLWIRQTYQQQHVLYTPRPAIPTRVDLAFLPSPPQKLPQLELTTLNYALSGSPHYDTFLRYLEVEGGQLEMYSECRLAQLKNVYNCTIGNCGWFNRIDKKQDLYSIQKLMLKHAIIIQRLVSFFSDMVKRYQALYSEFHDRPLVSQWIIYQKKMIAKTQHHSIMYGPLCDASTTLTLLGQPFQDMFNCYHRYSYGHSFTPTFGGPSKKMDIDQLYDQALSSHLPLSYELIFRLKILLYSLHDRILIVQSLTNSQWLSDKTNMHLPIDVLSVLWYQAHYRSISSQESQEQIDVQRKMLHRQESPFIGIPEKSKIAQKPIVLQSLTLSDEEQRTFFCVPPSDAVLDIASVYQTSRACDGKNVPEWIDLAYCNRFVQYCYHPPLPYFRLPILPVNVIDNSAPTTPVNSGGFFSRKTPPQNTSRLSNSIISHTHSAGKQESDSIFGLFKRNKNTDPSTPPSTSRGIPSQLSRTSNQHTSPLLTSLTESNGDIDRISHYSLKNSPSVPGKKLNTDDNNSNEVQLQLSVDSTPSTPNDHARESTSIFKGLRSFRRGSAGPSTATTTVPTKSSAQQSTTINIVPLPSPNHIELGSGLRSLDLDDDFFRDSVLLDFD